MLSHLFQFEHNFPCIPHLSLQYVRDSHVRAQATEIKFNLKSEKQRVR